MKRLRTHYTIIPRKKKVTSPACCAIIGNRSGIREEEDLQLGLSTAAFYGRWETEEAAQAIGCLPLDCCEVFLQTGSEYERDFARDVRTRLAGVRCTSMHPLGFQYENQLHARSQRQRRDALDMFRRALDAGAELDAGVYVYHGRATMQLTPLPWNLEANAEVLALMCEEAAQRNMVIGWENVFYCQLTTPERVLEAKKALPQVRFTLDIKQAMRAGCDPIAFVRAMGDRLCNVHVCDWNADKKLCLPGEGVFDFAALLGALRAVGYGGPVILEPYLALIGSDEALARSIAFMRNKIKE